ncbi:hypothetical protein [Nitratidesulfovibrio vulgaris]|uniref:Uncharacterized protein n=1 Tax=Nitratidesulfovibrio vulgaris (strain ATCC 29579 / DSM 644 / CCUG 34227 / NCIMB 8303 / VKM B-1760 / Hildenborough) TaxID=882 RepID=Q72BV8_NITV2|nr:hypothetical protein [Nitratidesulfovibrio vulgaris]AAS96004.1 hypothetical protein DVU_1526 [Nitratidesulfovibrio vulgaris str. Hildenborough]WCB45071.1 hypothetical protein PH214_08170 [Nitratidesulfovibrio vulgaris]
MNASTSLSRQKVLRPRFTFAGALPDRDHSRHVELATGTSSRTALSLSSLSITTLLSVPLLMPGHCLMATGSP